MVVCVVVRDRELRAKAEARRAFIYRPPAAIKVLPQLIRPLGLVTGIKPAIMCTGGWGRGGRHHLTNKTTPGAMALKFYGRSRARKSEYHIKSFTFLSRSDTSAHVIIELVVVVNSIKITNTIIFPLAFSSLLLGLNRRERWGR